MVAVAAAAAASGAVRQLVHQLIDLSILPFRELDADMRASSMIRIIKPEREVSLT